MTLTPKMQQKTASSVYASFSVFLQKTLILMSGVLCHLKAEAGTAELESKCMFIVAYKSEECPLTG